MGDRSESEGGGSAGLCLWKGRLSPSNCSTDRLGGVPRQPRIILAYIRGGRSVRFFCLFLLLVGSSAPVVRCCFFIAGSVGC
jgi:hypothetical protein